MDAFEKRQDMNVEYLKNVLVKFLMSENKQVKKKSQMSVEL